MPNKICPVITGLKAFCFSASAKNWAARSRHTSPLNATTLARKKPQKDHEQQQRVFGSLAERFGLFEQQTRLLHGGFGFRRSKTFDVNEREDECYLKIDLHAAQRGRAGQGRDLGEDARYLLNGFDQRRALQRRCPALPHRPTAFSICPASVQ